MVFVDEGGQAIIRPTVGVDKPKPDEIKLMEKVYSGVTKKDVKIEQGAVTVTEPKPISRPKPKEIELMEDVYSKTTGVEIKLEPSGVKVVEPSVVSHVGIKGDYYRSAIDILRTARDIDPTARYRLESGDVVSGEELRQQYVSVSGRVFMAGRSVQPGQYIVDRESEQYYNISKMSDEAKYIVEHSEPLERAIFYKSLGKQKTAEIALQKAYESLTPEEKIEYAKQYAKFGEKGDKTWSEVKREEPAAYLKVKDGKVVVEIDTQQWYKETYEDWEKKHYYETLTREFAFGITRFADPGHWGALASGKLKQYRSDIEYQYRKEYRIGTADQDVLKFYTGEGLLLSPAYINIVYPFAGGAAFGAAFRGIGAAAKVTTGVAGKILTQAASKGPLVAGGVMSGVIGADIGYTAAQQKKGSAFEDFTSPEMIKKYTQYGIMIASAGAGAKTVMDWQPTIGKAEVGQYILYRKHLTTFRGKPALPYGKTYAGFSTRGGIVSWETISPRHIKFEAVRYKEPPILQDPIKNINIEYESSVKAITEKATIDLLPVSQLSTKVPIVKIVATGYSVGKIASMMPKYPKFLKTPRPTTTPSKIQFAQTSPRVVAEKLQTKFLRMKYGGAKYLEKGEIVFTRKIPAEAKGGIYLEYIQKSQVKPITFPESSVYDEIVGTGRIFQPDIPGEYSIIGRSKIKLPIREREALDVFAGMRKTIFGEKIPKTGEPVSSVGKIRLVSEHRIPFEAGDVKADMILKTGKGTEYYKFVSSLKTLADTPTKMTGVGKTVELFKLAGKYKGHEATVSTYETLAETHIKSNDALVRGYGKIIDKTKWFGAEEKGYGSVSSTQREIFDVLKIRLPSRVTIADSKLTTDALFKQVKVTQVKTLQKGQVISEKPSEAFISEKSLQQSLETISKQSGLTKSISRSLVESKKDVITKEATKMESVVILKPATKEITKSIEKTIMKPLTKTITKSMSKVVLKPVTKVVTRPVTKTVTKQVTKLLTKSILKTVVKPTTKVVIKPVAKTILDPMMETPFLQMPVATLMGSELKSTLGHTGGYVVKVKKRQWVKGKKKYRTKWVKADKNALSEEDAMALGASIARKSARASFKIERVDEPPKKLRKKVKPWHEISFEFDPRPGGRFVERPEFRISSPGEVRQITKRGHRTPGRKGKYKRTKTRTKRRVR